MQFPVASFRAAVLTISHTCLVIWREIQIHTDWFVSFDVCHMMIEFVIL